MGSVTAHGLVKDWGVHRVVNQVSFHVPTGQFAVILGPSGCGKSTILRMIAGLDLPTAGSISIAGQDVTGLPGARRGIAMVFQSYALFPHLSVADNITFGLSIRGIGIQERKKRLNQVAELLNLGALLKRKPGQLSGGQQQRVALGRALVAQASVCLMDEPLSNLDAQLRSQLRSEIRDLQQRLGITLLYVTHDQTEAMSMADMVLLLHDGKLEQVGSPQALFARPASLFAARFLGASAMNFIDLAANPPGFAAYGQGQLTREITLGVRPEDIFFGNAASGECITAEVRSVEYLGADCLVTCKSGATTLIARQASRDVPQLGTLVRLCLSTETLHLFDTKTGQRLPDVPSTNIKSEQRSLS